MAENMSLLFGVPLWTFEMPNHPAVNEQLTQAVLAERNNDSGVQLSNYGGWQSHGKLHLNPQFQVLAHFITGLLGQVGRDYGFGAGANALRVTSMWANVNSTGNSNALHSHQSPSGMPNPLVLSGCYYVRVPQGSGAFVVEDFGRPMRYLQLPFQEPNLINSFTVKVPPREGALLLFPAWLEHRVDANASSEQRISIAFNVAFINTAQPAAGGAAPG